jgi:Ras-related C3 botulinum toxin substrate 1
MDKLPTMSIRCVVVGDCPVGKTCMLISCATNKFPTEHIPTATENYIETLTLGGYYYRLCLFDTVGQQEFYHMRRLSYPNTDVVLICFSVVNPNSFENVREKWAKEMRKYCQATFLLVGTQCDLSDNQAIRDKLAQKGIKDVFYRRSSPLWTVGGRDSQRYSISIAMSCNMMMTTETGHACGICKIRAHQDKNHFCYCPA